MRQPSSYSDHERNRGRLFSAILHAFFLLLAIFGLPEFLSPKPPEEPTAISVELLPITGITNIKPAEKPPAPEPKPEVKPEEKPPEPKRPTPPVKTETPPPAPPPPPPPPKPEAKPIPKPPEPKPDPKPKEKPKAKNDDLAAVLKAVKAEAQKTPDDKKTSKDATSPTKSMSNQYDASLPMSMSEKDAVRSQIAKCWNVPAGAKDAHELVVVLRLQLEQDGTVTKVELAGESKARASDSFFRAAADSAMRAVRQCSPLKNLPPEKYGTWRDMELTFDPKEMLF